MKKVTVVCLDNDKTKTVKALQDLGTLHISDVVTPASQDEDALRNKMMSISRLLKTAAQLAIVKTSDMKSHAPALSVEQGISMLDEIETLQQENSQIDKDLAMLAPWGSFDSQTLAKLEQGGVHVALCSATTMGDDYPGLPEDAVILPISQTPSSCQFAVVSLSPLDNATLPRATFPSCTDMAQLTAMQTQKAERICDLQKKFNQLANGYLLTWENLQQSLQDELAMTQARDGMGSLGRLAYLIGYIPETKLDEFRQTAYQQGWAFRYESIQPDDEAVPTLLNIPKRFKMAQQIFDFIGILPGYFETDTSVAIFIFLSLFVGILIGDAGYGALLCGLSAWGFHKAATDKAKEGLKLVLTFGLCILAFGWLSGNWFGIDVHCLPRFMKGIPWLYDDANSNHVKLLCFFIGAFHTSMARAWNAYNHQKSIRQMIGHLGWGIFLWGDFFLAKVFVVDGKSFNAVPFTAVVLFVLGFLLIVTCGIDWCNMGDVIYSPFTFINSFVDVLSYIRLFAVGLSGVYIAKCFNQMAGSLWDASPWYFPACLLVLLIGHTMNIAMAFLSVLVHGVRLNTLEFSGHIDVSWSGKPYRPLAHSQEP